MCEDKLWIKPQATPFHQGQNADVKHPAIDLSTCFPALLPQPSTPLPGAACLLAPGTVLHTWMGQLPGKHPWNTSKKTDYGVFWISTFFFTCPAYLYSNVNRLRTWTWKIPHMLSQTPPCLAPLAHTDLKSGRSFHIPSKKCILEQEYLSLCYLKVRNKYVKQPEAKWTVYPLGKQVSPCFAWGFWGVSKYPPWVHWSHKTISQEKTF